MKRQSLSTFMIECVCILAAAAAIIWCLDRSGLFSYDDRNNHTEKRWHYLQKMRGSTAADIMILGNSHAYCGLNPKFMTTNLGSNCFILGSNGIYTTDAYYMLKEALKFSSPKLLVIETYLLGDIDQKEMTDGDLICEFQSFEPRPLDADKVLSTFKLFSLDNSPYAWSKTLRNHSYVFDNIKQIKYNLKKPTQTFKDRIFLGQFARFTSGLTQGTLERYAKEGAPVNGSDKKINPENEKALKKIIDLCKSKGIKVMFLTIPMYSQHITNYDIWLKEQERVLGAYKDIPWLNLQKDYGKYRFTPADFEDTYEGNQHMTIHGSIVSGGALAYFIRRFFDGIPDRKQDPNWRSLFSDDEFFYLDNTPVKGEPGRILPVMATGSSGIRPLEADVLTEKEGQLVILKVDRKSFPDSHSLPGTLNVGVVFENKDGSQESATVPLAVEPYYYRQGYLSYGYKVKDSRTIRGIVF